MSAGNVILFSKNEQLITWCHRLEMELDLSLQPSSNLCEFLLKLTDNNNDIAIVDFDGEGNNVICWTNFILHIRPKTTLIVFKSSLTDVENAKLLEAGAFYVSAKPPDPIMFEDILSAAFKFSCRNSLI